ncbi:unnamed protein product [Phaeothamnion confervicola]
MIGKTVLCVLALVGGAAAYCPNSCSGHGSCGLNDKCTCYTRANGEVAWTGADCSERTCPKGAAWATGPVAINDNHPDVECSAAGVCDRSSGECACFDAYEGVACERSICPNDCSGKGFCYTEKQMAADAAVTYDTVWDAEKAVGCVCDAGYRGADCSLQECPSGDDVMKGDGSAEGRDCSGRGVCDYSAGLCKCFHGFYGSRCEYQTILY